MANSNINPQNSKVNSSTRSTSSRSSKSLTMADLMNKSKSNIVAPKKGDVLKGTITKLTSAEILIDIHAKTEAVVMENDKRILRNILSNFKLGDNVNVTVLNPESEMGNAVVSLRKHIDDILWDRLKEGQKNQSSFQGEIAEITKGGFLVDAKIGLSGFLPNSQTQFVSDELSQNPQAMIGKKIDVFILDLDRQNRKIIFSQRKVIGVGDFEVLIKDFKIGQKIDAVVSNIAPFGLFVVIQLSSGSAVDGLVHISEVAWEKTENLLEIYSAGQKIEAFIMGFDKDNKRINLSIKKLIKDPFYDIIKSYSVDQKVTGKVVRIASRMVFLEVQSSNNKVRIEGMIKKEKIPPTVTYKEGDLITATVSDIDREKHRLTLVPVLLEKPIGYR